MNLKILLVIGAVILTSSCSTIFTGTSQNITFETVPSGAKIQVNGIDRGTTPTSVKLKKGSSGQTVVIKKDGYQKRVIAPETTFNKTSILNLFNLLFWGVDAVTGALHKYDPTYYEIELERK